MKTVMAIIMVILFLLMLLGSGCTGECEDKQALQTYEIALAKEEANQVSIQHQLEEAQSLSERSILFGQLNASTHKTDGIHEQIEQLKKNSKCL